VKDQDKITSGIFNYTASIYDNIASKHNKDKQQQNGSNSDTDEVTPLQKKQKSTGTEAEMHLPTLWK